MVHDVEIHEWLEENDLFEFMKEAAFDSNGYGWNAGSLILNTGRDKINRIRRIDVYEARQAKNYRGNVSAQIFFCAAIGANQQPANLIQKNRHALQCCRMATNTTI
jgi:hypothetical protein